MEFTPDTSPPKRTRAKPEAAASPVEAKPEAVKKPRAPRKTPTARTSKAKTPTAKTAVAQPLGGGEVRIVAATLDPAPEDVGTMIATAAYYLAAARNFSPGHELDDWLEAERAIHAQM